MRPGPLVDPDTVPPWLEPLARRSGDLVAADVTRVPVPPDGGGRRAAVLVLFGVDEATAAPDLLLLRRSDGLSSHAGQVAFPGGALDDGDDGPVAAALREADEEVGVRATDVRPVAVLPELYLPPSDYLVTPVLAHWEQPGHVEAVDPGETAAVARVRVDVLADPANRLLVRGQSGWTFPAFVLPGMLVWGFTGGLVNAVLAMGGWERPWDADRVHDVDAAWRMAEETGVGW
ncbi:MAG: NUDIX domain-containing protein [Pseudonocardiaceae bacterium]|nr:NUDIX domain-containing protein [Pseudonocardiaceae bacterium]